MIDDFPADYKLFQSTPTYGGRPADGRTGARLRKVSIHAHVRWATSPCHCDHRLSRFQSTPTYGGRLNHSAHYTAGKVVSIHAHVRWATRTARKLRARISCFNPRPRTVGDGYVPGGDNQPARVSIHAHVRWATSSIPFPTRGPEFQSTPTYGGRLSPPTPEYERMLVSIHAHVRWATSNAHCSAFGTASFNPRPRTVGDFHRIAGVAQLHESFNPRPRTVGDVAASSCAIPAFVFQSTPTYGGRRNIPA